MEPTRYRLDPARSRVVVHTRAEGLLSPLAHDLEIAGEPAAGEAEAAAAGAWRARVAVAARALRVVGVVRRGRVDAGALAPRDRAEIERRMCDEVLAALPEIVAEARGAGEAPGRAVVRGARGEVSVPLAFERRPGDAGCAHIEGACALSLRALGVAEVRGPLGAFRVCDAVAVRFSFLFVPAP